MKTKKFVAIILCVVLLIFTGCSAEQQETITEKTYTPVNIEVVKKSDIRKTEIFTGQIQPLKEVTVNSKTPGEVKIVNYDIGDKIKKDEVLFTLDKTSIENNIKTLKSQLYSSQTVIKSAEIGLKMARDSQSKSQITQSQSGLESTRITYEDTKSNYEDMKKLFEQGGISKQQLDQVKVGYEQAKTAYEATKQSHELLTGKMIDENIDMAKIQLEQAVSSKNSLQVQLDNAYQALEDLEVKSPIDGVIAERNVDDGEMTGTGQPAFMIVDLDTVYVQINVPERLINKLSLNQKVNVDIKAAKDDSFVGTITKISPVADKATITYPVRIQIDNKEGIIKSGMFAEVIVDIEKSEGSIVVKRKDLELKDGQWSAYVVIDDIVHKAPVTLGVDNGVEVEVKKGLESGQQLIVKGREYVTDGEKVTVIE